MELIRDKLVRAMPSSYEEPGKKPPSTKDNLACEIIGDTLVVTSHLKDCDKIPADNEPYTKKTVFVGQVRGFGEFLKSVWDNQSIQKVVWACDFNAIMANGGDGHTIQFGEKSGKVYPFSHTFENWFAVALQSQFNSVMKYRVWTVMLLKMEMAINNIDGFIVFTRDAPFQPEPNSVILREATAEMEIVKDGSSPPATSVTDHRAVSCKIGNLQITTLNAGVGGSGDENIYEYARGDINTTNAIVAQIKETFINECKRYADKYRETFYNTLLDETNSPTTDTVFSDHIKSLSTAKPTFKSQKWYTNLLMEKFEYSVKPESDSVFNKHDFIAAIASADDNESTFKWETYADPSGNIIPSEVEKIKNETFRRNMQKEARKSDSSDTRPYINHPIQLALLHAWRLSYKNNDAFFLAMKITPEQKEARLAALFDKALKDTLYDGVYHKATCYQEVTYGDKSYQQLFNDGKQSDLRPGDPEHGIIRVFAIAEMTLAATQDINDRNQNEINPNNGVYALTRYDEDIQQQFDDKQTDYGIDGGRKRTRRRHKSKRHSNTRRRNRSKRRNKSKGKSKRK